MSAASEIFAKEKSYFETVQTVQNSIIVLSKDMIIKYLIMLILQFHTRDEKKGENYQKSSFS